jgi:hypothetical protein
MVTFVRAEGRPSRGLGPLNTAERAVSNAQYVRRSLPPPCFVATPVPAPALAPVTVPTALPADAIDVPTAVPTAIAAALASALIAAVTSSTVPVLASDGVLAGVVDTRR